MAFFLYLRKDVYKGTPVLTDPIFQKAFKLSIPTLFTYFPLGIIFAILWIQNDFPAFWAPIMSMFAFAGVVQMIALSMMKVHASIFAIFFAVIFVALRNVFYGLNFIERFNSKPLLLRLFLIFGLVDATYGILVTNSADSVDDDKKFCFYVTLLPFLYWITGTLLGAFIFTNLPTFPGIEFILTCFFMILVIDYYQMHKDKLCIIMPIIFAAICYAAVPNYFLLASIVLSTIFIYFFENYKLKTKEIRA